MHFSIAKFSKSPSGRVCTVMSHNLKNIYPRMLNTMWTLIQTCTLIPTPFTRTCASRMAHRLRQTKSLSSNTSNNNSSSSSRPSSRPLQSLSKTSPGRVLTGCNFNEVRTRCKRGPNEVRNQILGDWPPKSPDKLFGSHTLSHSFQNS